MRSTPPLVSHLHPLIRQNSKGCLVKLIVQPRDGLSSFISAIRLAKKSLYDNAERDLKSSLERETFSQNIASETEDAREGIRAFVEKRDPKFQGR